MGKLAIKLSVAVAAVGNLLAMVCMTLNWNVTQSIGVLNGNQIAYWSLFRMTMIYKYSLVESGAKAITGKGDMSRGRSLTGLTAFEVTTTKDAQWGYDKIVISLQNLYTSQGAMEQWKKFIHLNGAMGSPWQVKLAFWSGMLAAMSLVIGMICFGLFAANINFYMADKFNRKLRNKAKMWMVACLFAHVMALVFYVPAWAMMGQNQLGMAVNAIPGARIAHGRASVPGPALFVMVFVIVLVSGALGAAKSWKSESGEFREDRKRQKREMTKFLDESSSEDEEQQDMLGVGNYGHDEWGDTPNRGRNRRDVEESYDDSDSESGSRKKKKKKDKKEKKRSGSKGKKSKRKKSRD